MNKYLFPFEKLDAWSLSIDLAEYVLNNLEGLPQNRHIRVDFIFCLKHCAHQPIIYNVRNGFYLERSGPLTYIIIMASNLKPLAGMAYGSESVELPQAVIKMPLTLSIAIQ